MKFIDSYIYIHTWYYNFYFNSCTVSLILVNTSYRRGKKNNNTGTE